VTSWCWHQPPKEWLAAADHRAVRLRNLTGALGVLCVLAALGAASATPRVRRLLDPGTLRLESSRTAPLFDLERLAPGTHARRALTIRNAGTLAATWSLTGRSRGGAALLWRLRLRVDELGPDRRVVYAGPVASLGRVDLGVLPAGASRRFVFSLAWPASARGTAGAESARVDFAWRASASWR
jgi:hypothetical protein